jgi:hypothetical protein
MNELEPVWQFHLGDLQIAKAAAAVVFVTVLSGLGVGLYRVRQKLERDEVDATLEADFQRIERELSAREKGEG